MTSNPNDIRDIEMGGLEDTLVHAIIARIHSAPRRLDAFDAGTITLSNVEVIRLKATINHLTGVLILKGLLELQRLINLEDVHLKNEDLLEEGMMSWHHRKADFDQWSRRGAWSVEECVALILGFEPEAVNWELIEESALSSRVGRQYRDRREEVQRAVQVNSLQSPITPSAFIAWARMVGYPVPEVLAELVKQRNGSYVDWRARCAELEEKVNDLRNQIGVLEGRSEKGGKSTQELTTSNILIVYFLEKHFNIHCLHEEYPLIPSKACEDIALEIQANQKSSTTPKTVEKAFFRIIDGARAKRSLSLRVQSRKTSTKV